MIDDDDLSERLIYAFLPAMHAGIRSLCVMDAGSYGEGDRYKLVTSISDA